VGPQLRQLELPPDKRWSYETIENVSLAYPVAEFIKTHTRPGRPIYMTGSHPEVYWLTHRQAPTRYFDIYPLTTQAARRERLRDLEADPPAAIGVMPDPDARNDFDSLYHFASTHGYAVAFETSGAAVWLSH
jgi:hypothetical protein